MKIWDPIRKLWVVATEEERVRQKLIRRMIAELGYPKHLLAVEKDLSSLPHRPLLFEEDPHRRLDLLCFAPVREGGLLPLLLVECKVEKFSAAARKQIEGYNAIVRAPFLSFAWAYGVETLWYEKGRPISTSFLPPFSQLVEAMCSG